MHGAFSQEQHHLSSDKQHNDDDDVRHANSAIPFSKCHNLSIQIPINKTPSLLILV